VERGSGDQQRQSSSPLHEQQSSASWRVIEKLTPRCSLPPGNQVDRSEATNQRPIGRIEVEPGSYVLDVAAAGGEVIGACGGKPPA
jgi:hypothetical protein